MIQMVHPELPGAVINVIDPRGAAVHRKSGWRATDDILVPCSDPDCHVLMGAELGDALAHVKCAIHTSPS